MTPLLFVLRWWVEALLDNVLGHFIIGFVFWLAVQRLILPLLYWLMRNMGPIFASLPFWLRRSIEKCILLFSILTNRRILLDPIFEVFSTFAIIAIDVYRCNGQKQYNGQDLELFFRLGTPVRQSGVLEPHFRANMGSGNPHDPANRFFPEALTTGPRRDQFWTSDITERQLHGRIAKTCAFLSILSYQTDKTIRDCMREANMLPNVSFYTVATGPREIDLSVFVDRDRKWAVFCFRGTEPETIRDWLTSILVARPQAFETSNTMTVRSRYYQDMLDACQKYHLKPSPRPEKPMRASELAVSLSKGNCKIYYSGHSLGGGLASLLGAHMTVRKLPPPAAVITFGSPPVAANEAFIDWYTNAVPRSWRFVNGNEFAPMAPPLPFTTNYKFYHVQQLILARDMQETHPHVPTPAQIIERLDRLNRERQLLSIIVDHNPALTLRALDYQIPS